MSDYNKHLINNTYYFDEKSFMVKTFDIYCQMALQKKGM